MLHVPLPAPTQRARSHGRMADASSKYTALFGLGLRLSDVAVVWLGGVLAYWMRFGTFELPTIPHRTLISAIFFSALVFSASPLYRSWRGRGLTRELLTLFGTFVVLFAGLMVYAAALQISAELSRLWRLSWFFNSLGGAVAARVFVRNVASFTRRAGLDQRTAVVVGGSHDAVRIIDALHRNRSAGIKLLGRFQSGALGREVHGTPYLGDIDALAEYVEHHHIHQVWIALPVSEQHQINRILELLVHSTAEIKFVPDLFGMQLLNHSVEQVAGLPVINLRANPLNGDAYLLKTIENRVIASLILLLIAPLLVVLAIGVKLSSPGPVMFKQKRHGLGGKVIEVWKFRSMRIHEEAHGTVTQATRFDKRVTPFGRFLRRTSLDELPQFCNVLHGTMSVVGPRPHAIAHNHHYRDIVEDYMQRHRIKPGITGWAQVNGHRGETDTVDKMRARVQHDLYYMQNWSLAFDLKIIAMTLAKGFVGRNAY